MHASRLKAWQDARILVVGDVMLDRYVRGSVTRISPEAPIPVLRSERQDEMPGGAGNVARNITALGGEAVILGFVGPDDAGRRLKKLLAANHRMTVSLATVADGNTIEKWRFGTHQHQMLRVDREDDQLQDCEALAALFRCYLPSANLVVLSDYGKGALPPALIRDFLAQAGARGIAVVVDPKRSDCGIYDGATVMTPNRSEAEAMTGISCHCDQSAAAAGARLLEMLPKTGAILITRGSQGMTLAQRAAEPVHIRAHTRATFDVSGAGDTVCAALALCMAGGHCLLEAAHIANDAAGLVVAQPGTATVTRAMLEHEQKLDRLMRSEHKIVTLPTILAEAEGWHGQGLRVGFTNGCFDLIHPGHIALLSQAKATCDRLIVGLNSDASVRRLKGPARPVQDELSRALMLAALASVDRVVIFDQDTPLSLVVGVRPDVLIKGKGYRLDTVVGADIVKQRGGEVVLVDQFGEHSTTDTILRLISVAGAKAS